MKKLIITLIIAAWALIGIHGVANACEGINFTASDAEISAARVKHPDLDDYDLQTIINKEKIEKAKKCRAEWNKTHGIKKAGTFIVA